MADRRAPSGRRADSAAAPRKASVRVPDARIANVVARGPECAFANVRMLGRVVGAFYDDMLRPAELRAAQLALLWAIVAREPVDQKELGRITETDQTTLSRTVENLRAAGLVIVARGTDRRTRIIRLSPRGRAAFARALPFWEEAQRRLAESVSLDELARLARAARRFSRARLTAPGKARA
ncbi:MAG TPA: MarR family winged helix-turn-helix transcriptional regulator [Casimicrobiaceae bacterium]|nr:MarR family winged helix-turn-helix transcriptional regulator [Casimicrobiaceae bacterium]